MIVIPIIWFNFVFNELFVNYQLLYLLFFFAFQIFERNILSSPSKIQSHGSKLDTVTDK